MFDPQQTLSLGKTNVKITRMGLGTGVLGGLNEVVTEERFQATIEAAFGAGIRYFDTAPLYGLGVSEQRLGAILAAKPRATFALSTKIGRLLRTDESLEPGAEVDHLYDTSWVGVPQKKLVIDYSYDATMRSLEESLNRLGLDRVDIVYIHDAFTAADFKSAMNGAYRAVDQLRSEKVIGAVGVGIGLSSVLVQFANAGNFDCFILAGRYTLLDHDALSELLPLCLAKNISIVLAGVYNSGILADPWHVAARFEYEPANQGMIARARQMDEIGSRYGIPLKAAALQFPMAHPAVVTILTGATRPQEIDENVQLAQLPIPAQFWTDLRSEGLLPPHAPTP